MQRLSAQCSPLYGWAPKLASQSLEQRGGSEPLFSLEASFRPGPGWFQQVPVLDSSQFSSTGVEAGAAFPSSALWMVKGPTPLPRAPHSPHLTYYPRVTERIHFDPPSRDKVHLPTCLSSTLLPLWINPEPQLPRGPAGPGLNNSPC